MKGELRSRARLTRSQCKPAGWLRAALIGLLCVAGPHALGQTPTITFISPSTVAAGSAAFTLRVTGTNYNATSTVSVGGTVLTPSTETAALLLVTVPAQLVLTPTQLPVQVTNGPTPGGPLNSNTLTLTVAKPGTAPVLTSATPGFPVRGETEVQMTLVGSNFRPGATVVISPPLPTLSASTGNLQAADVNVVSVTLINAGLMTARINVSPAAAVGLRAVDVLNVDGTNTAGGVGPLRRQEARSQCAYRWRAHWARR